MGNENSSKNTTQSVPNYQNYQPPVDSFAHYSYPEKNPAIHGKRKYDSKTKLKSKVPEEPAPNPYYHQQPSSHQSRQPTSLDRRPQLFSIANKEPSTLVPTTEQPPPVLVEKPLSSGVLHQQISSPSDDTSNNISSPNTVTASSLEKAPMIHLNYVVKSSDNKSIHTYGPDNMTVMHRTSSESVTNGNRWYDKNYNKNISPLVVKYL